MAVDVFLILLLVILIGGGGVLWGLLAALAIVAGIAVPMGLLVGTWEGIKKLTD